MFWMWHTAKRSRFVLLALAATLALVLGLASCGGSSPGGSSSGKPHGTLVVFAAVSLSTTSWTQWRSPIA